MKNFYLNLRKRKGIASLPAIILLGGIVVEVGVAGAVLLFYLNNSLYGTKLANEALSAAQSGINEGIRQVILDKDISGNLAALSIGNGTAEITINPVTCVSTSCTVEVVSVGTVVTREHTVTATLNVDSDTGLVSITSIKE